MAYTFDFLDARGSIGHFELHLCEDHSTAMLKADAALRASSTAAAVDVWFGAGRVGRIEGVPSLPA